MEYNVLILKAELSTKKEDVFRGLKDDEILINAIDEFIEKLNNQGIEIWERNKNIIIAEDGYYLSAYVDDVQKI